MPENGFTVMPRKAFKSDPLWLEKRAFNKWEAWQDLIQRAQYKDGNELKNWNNIKLQRGQVLTSISSLAERWNRSRNWVRNLLKALTNWDRIKTSQGQSFIIITICNYDKYQSLDSYVGQQPDNKKTLTGQQKDINGTHTRQVKQEKKVIIPEVDEVFTFWNSLNLTKHRKLTDKQTGHINSKLKDFSVEEIKEAMSNYARIINHKGFYFTYRWSLDEFLTRSNGFEKFLTENRPFHNYLNGEHWTEGEMERWLVPENRAREAPPVQRDDEVFDNVETIRDIIANAPFNQEG